MNNNRIIVISLNKCVSDGVYCTCWLLAHLCRHKTDLGLSGCDAMRSNNNNLIIVSCVLCCCLLIMIDNLKLIIKIN